MRRGAGGPVNGPCEGPGERNPILSASAEAGAAVGFAVHVPHYLAQAAYPAAAVTLLESVTRATGLSLPDEALREAARRTDEEIGRQVEASEEIAELVLHGA